MDVGMMMLFTSYGWDDCPDGQVWEEELRLAAMAADLGFDCLWSTEHHFNDYSFIPDNVQLMSYLTALYPDIDVGTAAVILRMTSSGGGPGPLGMAPTSPRKRAPASMARCASASLWMQQTFTRTPLTAAPVRRGRDACPC